VIARAARRLRGESGLTMIELLVGSVLMIVVMGVAFTALSQFETTTRRNNEQNDAQDRARNAIDLAVKRLRNDAAPTPGSPQGLDRATPTDLIFQSVDPEPPAAGSANSHNVMRVRYCLDVSNPRNGKVWVSYQRWSSATAPAAPSSSSCPDAGWTGRHVVADHVVNTYGATPRPVWTIDCPSGFDAATCDAGTSPSMLARVKRVGMELFIDEDPAEVPSETRLATAVYFRNQNARPAAVVTPAPVQPVGSRVAVNASSSSDPDADRLFYRWCYYGTNVPSSTWCANGTEIPQRTVGIDYAAPAPPGTTVTVGLRVQDPGGLVAYDNIPVVLK
jgi:type II secretory pathway pseudopilin PulG